VIRSLPTLSNLLKDDDLSVRKAAGEAVALLYESSKDLLEDSEADDISDHPALASSRAQPTHKLAANAGERLEVKEAEVRDDFDRHLVSWSSSRTLVDEFSLRSRLMLVFSLSRWSSK
jgi:hypothetical protein